MTEQKQIGIPGRIIVWKVAFHTVGRYGKISLFMLFVGFFFVLTTADAYSQLHKELSSPYVLSGSVAGQAELDKYCEISSVEAATPVVNVDATLSSQDASLSSLITAVISDYLDVTFSQGGVFPDESNMPFLVLNRYAAEHFLTQEKTTTTVEVNETVMMSIQEQEVPAVICGIFEDGLEQSVVYMSYALASKILPKEETISLMFRLKRTYDLEEAAQELDQLHVSVTYDGSLPERWKLTKQQISQAFLSALVLLMCSAIQIAGQNQREQQEALPELQALFLIGIEESSLRSLKYYRSFFAELGCILPGMIYSMLRNNGLALEFTAGILCLVVFSLLVWLFEINS